MSLLETFGKQTCLVTIHDTICFLLDLIDPLAVNEITVRLWRNQFPSLIALEGITLLT
jgi:hypothetical protein